MAIFEYPLKQHIGAEAVPTLAKDDEVKRGQLLAFQKEGTLGANIYASINGRVSCVSSQSIFIEADPVQDSSYIRLKGNDPADLIRQAGIVGLGGAGFPTYAKLAKCDSVIINAAECEPILSHNIKRMETEPASIIRGLEIAMEVCGAKEGIIAIKAHNGTAISALENALKNLPQRANIRLSFLENMYPAGEERAIVRDTLGKLLPVNALPIEAGAVVINAETALRIKEAVDDKKPLIDKDLTVAGKTKGNKSDKLIQTFFDVPLGTSVASLIDRAGGMAERSGEIIMGGPFTGRRTYPDSPIIKTTGGIIISECFPKGPSKIGLLVCACGADEKRLREIAASLGSTAVGVERCKQAMEVNGSLKCENPGHCPGQVQKIMALKKAGAEAVLISNCTDCTNTVMSCAPKLGLPVYHCTDGVLRAVNMPLIRRIKK